MATIAVGRDYASIWSCKKCGDANRWANNTCNNCHSGHSDEPREWICGKCHTVNSWNNNYCNCCGKHYEATS